MKTPFISIIKLVFVFLLLVPLFIQTTITQDAYAREWQKTFGGEGGEYGYSVQQTNDGGYIIAGICSGAACLIKTDAFGNKLWQKTLGEQYGFSVQQTTDGGYIIAGRTYRDSSVDIYLIKTDAYGNSEWKKTFGGYDNDDGRSVQQTSDGGYIIAGYTSS